MTNFAFIVKDIEIIFNKKSIFIFHFIQISLKQLIQCFDVFEAYSSKIYCILTWLVI